MLGVPFYGYNFDPVGSAPYSRIIEGEEGNAYKNERGKLYYNGIPEIVRKTEFAKARFNGVMIWELSQDTDNELSLLRSIHQMMWLEVSMLPPSSGMRMEMVMVIWHGHFNPIVFHLGMS